MSEQPSSTPTPPETQLRSIGSQLDTLTTTLQHTLTQLQDTHHAASLRKTLSVLTKQAAKLTNTADLIQYEQQAAATPGPQTKTTVERLPPWAIVGISCLCGVGAFLGIKTIVENYTGNLLNPHSWNLLIGILLMSAGYVLTGAVTAWLHREQAEKLALIAGAVFIVLNFLAGDVSGWGWLRIVLSLPLCLAGTFLVPKFVNIPAPTPNTSSSPKANTR